MRLLIHCTKCLEELGFSSNFSLIEFEDGERYETICAKNHKSTTFLQQQKFEILFEIGAYAIQDGYYREAISSFTSSLERFYEFSILVLISKNDIDYSTFSDTWKLISNQSERQLGAFIFLYLQEFKQKPILLHSKNIELRNKVVHKGKIPNKLEAINYGQAILDIARPLLAVFKKDFSNIVRQLGFDRIQRSQNKDDKDRFYSHMCIPTILSISIRDPSYDLKTLEEAIASLVRYSN